MASVDSLSILITASTTTAARKIGELTAALGDLSKAINGLDVSKFETLASATGALTDNLKGLKGSGVKQIENTAKALQNVSENKHAFDGIAEGAKKSSEATKEISQNAQELSTDFGKMQGVSIDGLAESMKKVSNTIGETTSKMSTFKSILAKTKIIIPTEGLDKVNKRVEKLTERIEDLRDKMNFKSANQADYVDSAEMEKDQEKIAGLVNELERLKLKKQELESHGGFKLNAKSWGITDIYNGFKNLNKQIDKFISKMFRVKSATRGTSKATNDFSLASMKLAKELTKVTKMLKLMITRMVLRKVIQGVTDGFKNLAQYSSTVNASLSLLWNSFRQLGNSIAAAVSPLLTALAPALNYLIQLVIKAVNVINQLISALTGMSTWTRAKTLTDDYAKSLDKSNKSAKDLKRTILGFDEINKLDDNKDSGGGMTKPEDMFEDAKIEAKWADMAKKLKSILNQLLAPIKKAWTNIGDQVANAWKKAFKSVKKLLGDIGKDFLKVWNQPKTVKMLENILKIFRDIGLIVKNLADGLDRAWNKNKTGLRILEGIRDIFAIVIEHVKNMTTATVQWAKELNFTPLLEAFKNWVVSMKPVVNAIAGAFEDFYTRVLLPLGKWTMEKGLPELIQVFTDFNEKVKWDLIKERVDRLWDALAPFAQTIGEGLIKFIDEASDKVGNFLNSDAWDSFIDSCVTITNTVDGQDIYNTLKLIVDGFLLFKGLTFLTETAAAISKLVSAIQTATPIIKDFAAYMSEGFVIGASMTFDKFIKGSCFDPDEWNNALGKIYDYLGIWWNNLVDFATTFVVPLTVLNDIIEGKGFLQTFKENWQTIEEYKKSVEDLKAAGKDAGGTYEDLVRRAKLLHEEQTTGLGITAGVAKDLKTTYDGLQVDFDKVAKSSDNLKDSLNNVSESSQNIGNSASNLKTYEGAAKNLQDAVSRASESIKNSSNVITIEIPNEMANAQFEMSNTWHTLSKDVSDSTGEIQKSVDDSMVEVTKSFDTVQSEMTEDKWTFSGVIEGLTKTFKDAFKGAAEWWNKFTDQVNGEHSIFGKSFTINLPKIKGFATGGFPEDDSLFFANSTEMLGKFSNGQNVVANNQQITDGIAQAVYSAIISANGSGGATKYINNTIQIDGRTIARAVTMGQDDMNRRFSPVTV